MSDKVYNVLFLSRRNTARSILAEAILKKIGKGRFKAFSAGIDPEGAIDPNVLSLMEFYELPLQGARPKHYREFTGEDAPQLDFMFTLSDTAAGEKLPEWPGMPVTAHWSSTDPVLFEGEPLEIKQAFRRTMTELERRLSIFVNLPFASLDRMSLKSEVEKIGEKTPG
ncbi:MAG: arsenate reductase ArsC [Rhizobiaceae bacterium]|nr:arsenate reductase ArsC [Rhizobiaceae bacterium]